jgi:hypothetical protein
MLISIHPANGGLMLMAMVLVVLYTPPDALAGVQELHRLFLIIRVLMVALLTELTATTLQLLHIPEQLSSALIA